MIKPFCLRLIVVFMVTLLLCSRSFGQDNKEKLKWPDFIVKGKLENGMQYFIMEHKKPKNRIQAWIVVKAGSIQETEKERGIAHFMEHMGFNGTKHFPPGELVKYFQSIGTDIGPDINAFTSFDRTTYMIEVSTEKEEYLNKAFDALSDYAGFMSLLPEEIEKEKGVILEELRLGSDVDKRVSEKEWAVIFKDSLYPERFPIGIKETISAFTPEDFKRFYASWYRPDMMSLIVVGDFKAPAIEKKVKDCFGQIASSKEKMPDLIVPFKPHKEIYTCVITDPELKSTSLNISYLREPSSLNTIEDYRKLLVDRLIFQMINMRFRQEKYKLNTPVISSGGYASGWLKSLTEVSFYASVKPGKSLDAVKVITGYIEGLRQGGFSDVERQEAQSELLQSMKKSKEEKDTRLARYYTSAIMNATMHDGVFLSPEEEYSLAVKIFPEIKNEEIISRVKYLMEPVNMSVIVTAPVKDAGNITKEKILSSVESIIKSGGTAYSIEKINYSYDYSKLKGSKVLSKKYYKSSNVTELKLANGLTVLLKPTDFDKDTVMVNYVSLGGKLLEKPDTPGMFDVASIAWGKGGTKDLTQFQVDRLLKGTNIRLMTGGSSMYGIYGNSSREELEKLCQWMWQYLQRPGYREEGIASAITSLQDNLRWISQYQEGAMMDVESKLLLPGHPRSASYNEEDIAGYTDPENLKSFQTMSCVPSNSELTIIGAFKLEDGINVACKYFGSIPSGKKPSVMSAYLRTEFPPGNTRYEIYKGMENRCLASIYFPGCMKSDKDTIALKVLAKILDTRYWNKIREEKSLAYAVWAANYSSLAIKGYGRFEIGFGTNPEKINEVIRIAMNEIKELRENGPSKEELESAKKVLLSGHEEEIERNYYWVGQIEGSSLFNYNFEKSLKEKDEVEKITEKDIQVMAKKYLHEQNNIILLALPEKKDKK